MRTTIDVAGRVVIPKRIRDSIGLTAGQSLEITVIDGRIEIEPAATEVSLELRDGVLVAVPHEPLPPLTTALVRETIEGLRR